MWMIMNNSQNGNGRRPFERQKFGRAHQEEAERFESCCGFLILNRIARELLAISVNPRAKCQAPESDDSSRYPEVHNAPTGKRTAKI
jgi:hypothetical protein